MKQDPENARAHNPRNISMIERALQEVGAARSVVIDEDNVLLAGNGVYEAAVAAGIENVQIVEADGDTIIAVKRTGLTPEQKKRLALFDNRTAELADWNVEQIVADLEAGLDLDGIFAQDELSEMLEGFADGLLGEEPPEPQIDKAEELREKWGVKLGHVWRIPSKTGDGEHRIICGDCTDAEVVERVMGGEKAQLCVTSPPYAVGKEYEADVSFDAHLALLRGFADRVLDVIEPGGFAFVNFGEIAPQSHTKPLTGSQRQCLYPISKDYWQIFHVERDMDLYAMRIWYKPFNRLQQPFWTYHTSIPHYQEWEHLWTWRLPGGDGDECFDWDISGRAVWDTRNEATDDKPLTRHVAAFPVGIPERAIKAHSADGAIVWEPFSGSGTVLVVCEKLKRKCRAAEISPGYVAVSLQRLSDMGLQPERVE